MIRYLALLVGLFSSVIAQGAGRVFHDNFEGGAKSPQWTTDTAFYTPCSVVTAGVDGGLAHDGSGQLQCFWHGGLPPGQYRSSEVLPSWNYNREFFTRFWFRLDHDTDASFNWPHGEGLTFFGIDPSGYNTNNGQNFIAVDVTAMIADQRPLGGNAADGTLHISWLVDGGGYSGPNFFGLCYAYDGYYGNCLYPQKINTADHQWHELEIYHKDDTFTSGGANNHDGIIKTWIDHHLVIDVENDHTTINGAKWNNFNIALNWWNSNGLTTNNHVYFDGVEIFSDALTDGSTGSMVDASIAAPVVCTP